MSSIFKVLCTQILCSITLHSEQWCLPLGSQEFLQPAVRPQFTMAQQLLRSYQSHFYRNVLGAGTTDTEVCTRVCARLWSKSGEISSCLTQSRRVFDGLKKSVSPCYWFIHAFYSNILVAPPLGFQSRGSWCTELESPAAPTSHRPPNFRMRLHQAAFIRLYTQQQPNYTAVSSCAWNNLDQWCDLFTNTIQFKCFRHYVKAKWIVYRN